MNRGIHDLDTEEVDKAVEILREEGFAVDSIQEVRSAGHGVEFDLSLYAPSRRRQLDPEGNE